MLDADDDSDYTTDDLLRELRKSPAQAGDSAQELARERAGRQSLRGLSPRPQRELTPGLTPTGRRKRPVAQSANESIGRRKTTRFPHSATDQRTTRRRPARACLFEAGKYRIRYRLAEMAIP